MKKTKLILIVILLSLLLAPADAAKPDFKVLASNGKVTYRKNNKGSWKKIVSGLELNKNDRVKLGQNSYLGLVHSSGKTEEITKKGSYKISDLSKAVARRKSSMAKRFADYVVDEMGDVDDMLASGDYHDQMETTGAVERAVEFDFSEKDKIKDIAKTGAAEEESVDLISGLMGYVKEEYIVPRLPRNSYVLDTKISFSWYKKEGHSKYTITITDNKNKVLFSEETPNTSISVDLNTIKAEPGSTYYWSVQSGDAESMECSFSLKDTKAPGFARDYRGITEIEKSEKSALDLLVLASFYEEYNIMNRAADCYKKAMEAAPAVADYKKMYASYLNRIGLVSESRALLKK